MKHSGSFTFSFWEQETFLAKAELIIIGSGIVGLSAALEYRALSPKARIVVIDRGALPKGASTRNAGFACFGSVSEVIDDLQHTPEDEVIATIKMRWEGLQLLRSRVPDLVMEYENCGGVEIFKSKEEFESNAASGLLLNALLEQNLGLKEVYTPISTPSDVSGMRGFKGKIINKYEGLLHPGKMIQHLIKLCHAADIPLINGLNILNINESTDHISCHFDSGKMIAEKILIATNGFAGQFLPNLELHPARNLVLITTPINGMPLHAGYHMDKGYVYFRPVGNRVLIGGARNLDIQTESSAEFQENPLIRHHLEKLLYEQILPGQFFEVEQSWTGIMGVGKVKKPIIEMQSERLGIAVRMGGMGVAIGSLVGKQAANMIRFGEITR